MKIVLNNGNIISPMGELEITAKGVEITRQNGIHILPMNQIQWIYTGKDKDAEDKFVRLMKSKQPSQPIDTSKPTEDLIKELYT